MAENIKQGLGFGRPTQSIVAKRVEADFWLAGMLPYPSETTRGLTIPEPDTIIRFGSLSCRRRWRRRAPIRRGLKLNSPFSMEVWI